VIVVWILVYVLAGAGLLGLVLVAVLLALVARDTRRIKRERLERERLERERLEREGNPLSARERRVLRDLEHGEGGS
jgi:type III secretory pathway component EscU